MDVSQEEKDVLKLMIQSIVDALKEGKESEDFEEYAHQLRIRIYKEMPGYEERFFLGYKSILETLKPSQ